MVDLFRAKEGKALEIPSSIFVQLHEQLGITTHVPDDYDPDGWNGEWGFDVPELEKFREVFKETAKRLDRIRKVRDEFDKLANADPGAPTLTLSGCQEITVSTSGQ